MDTSKILGLGEGLTLWGQHQLVLETDQVERHSQLWKVADLSEVFLELMSRMPAGARHLVPNCTIPVEYPLHRYRPSGET